MTRGDGVWVYDERGRRYFDTLSGMWLNNIGHGRREIADAVHARGKRITSHATILDGARVAANAGVDSIEHGFAIDDDVAGRASH